MFLHHQQNFRKTQLDASCKRPVQSWTLFSYTDLSTSIMFSQIAFLHEIQKLMLRVSSEFGVRS